MAVSSPKLAFVVVLLVFATGGTTWTIGAEGRSVEDAICRKRCHKPCHCFYGICLCPKDDSSLISRTSKFVGAEGKEVVAVCDRAKCKHPCYCLDFTCRCNGELMQPPLPSQ